MYSPTVAAAAAHWLCCPRPCWNMLQRLGPAALGVGPDLGALLAKPALPLSSPRMPATEVLLYTPGHSAETRRQDIAKYMAGHKAVGRQQSSTLPYPTLPAPVAEARLGDMGAGKCVSMWAPGADIISASRAGDAATEFRSGTSQAVPFVAGAVALYLENKTCAARGGCQTPQAPRTPHQCPVVGRVGLVGAVLSVVVVLYLKE